MTTLQKNSLQQMADTLRDLSSQQRQLEYKSAVPFVHVPRELIAQWDRYARMVREEEAPWFRELFSRQELEAIAEFDEIVGRTCPPGEKLPDVPEILNDPRWLHLIRRAEGLSRVLSPRLPPPTERMSAGG